MSKDPIPLIAPDISRFARSIAKQLNEVEDQPSHLSLMNMFARAAGFRNYQHLRGAHSARARLANERLAENVDYRLVERALNQFDQAGRMVRWPSRRPVQEICLWVLWSQLPPGNRLQEREVNQLLIEAHLFNDPASLRRSLFCLGLVNRNLDGSDYQRQEKHPPIEAREVISRIKARREAQLARHAG